MIQIPVPAPLVTLTRTLCPPFSIPNLNKFPSDLSLSLSTHVGDQQTILHSQPLALYIYLPIYLKSSCPLRTKHPWVAFPGKAMLCLKSPVVVDWLSSLFPTATSSLLHTYPLTKPLFSEAVLSGYTTLLLAQNLPSSPPELFLSFSVMSTYQWKISWTLWDIQILDLLILVT